MEDFISLRVYPSLTAGEEMCEARLIKAWMVLNVEKQLRGREGGGRVQSRCCLLFKQITFK